ncbi:MAG: hypothetical protein WC299_16485, partial [Kiritimatiellia bacterium]
MINDGFIKYQVRVVQINSGLHAKGAASTKLVPQGGSRLQQKYLMFFAVAGGADTGVFALFLFGQHAFKKLLKKRNESHKTARQGRLALPKDSILEGRVKPLAEPKEFFN